MKNKIHFAFQEDGFGTHVITNATVKGNWLSRDSGDPENSIQTDTEAIGKQMKT